MGGAKRYPINSASARRRPPAARQRKTTIGRARAPYDNMDARYDLANRTPARPLPNEIDAIEDRIYDHNSYATGRHDGRRLGFVIRNELGQMIGVVAGFTWSGACELKQMWIDEAYRGRGYARALLDAFAAEARSRDVRRIWVASYDFQAPGMYERAGFKRMAEFEGWPEGHTNVVLCKTLSSRES